VAVSGFLGLLLVASFAFYLARVSGVAGGLEESDGGEGFTSRANPDLPQPANVKVVAERGTTITWEGPDDIRVIGYNIYRYKGAGDTGSRINSAIVSDTVYHDDEGTMFDSYVVVPVDTMGREGGASAPVAATEQPRSITTLEPVREPEKLTDHAFEGSSQGEEQLPRQSPQLLDCTAPGMVYSGDWYLEHYDEVLGGTLMVTPYAGDYFTYTFAGDGVTVISARHWNYGIMEVYLDGELRAQVDLYSDTVQTGQRVFTASGLGPGAHTIKLVCTGRSNPSAYFTFIDLEALEVE
jgi:hypothetical protein